MKVITDTDEILLGTTEVRPTIGIIDYSRRATDDFGVTTVVERGFARRLSVRFAMPFDEVDSLQQQLAALRATAALWVADDRFDWLSVNGFYKDFSLDLAVPPTSYCTLTIEGLAESEPVVDAGGDPAPDGQESTLRLLQPLEVTDAVLTSSSVAETDYPAWSSGTTYAAGERVIKTATHRIYESLSADNVGHDPATSPANWMDIGPTNRWAMFDQALGSLTSAAGSIAVTLSSGGANAVALLDVTAATVRVQAAGYDETLPVSPGALAFLDMPSTSGPITVAIAGPDTVSVGTLLVGQLVALGITEASPTAGIDDFSRKEIDDFGEVTIVPRSWRKRMGAKALIRTDAIDDVANRIAAVRARPSLWIGDEGTDSLTIYGFFKDFAIEVGENVSTLSLSVEGLSEAQDLTSGGSTAISAFLTNEAHSVPANSAGAVTSYSGATGQFEIYSGIADISASFTLSTAENPQGLTVSYVGQTYTVTGGFDAGEANASLTIRATGTGAYAGVTLEKVFSLSKAVAGAAGAAGADGISGQLTNTSFVVAADSAGVVTSYDGATGTFAIEAGGTDISSAFTLSTAANPQGLTVSYVGRQYTVTGGFDAGELTASVTIRATGSGTYSGVVLDRVFSLGKAKTGVAGSGTPAVNVTLSKAAASVYAYANGTVVSWAPATGQLKVYSGSTDVTASATLTATPSAGVSGSIDASGVYQVTAMSTDSGTLTLTAVYGGLSYVREFTVSKITVGYEIVSALPSTNLFEGRIVFLDTDGKLYRYHSGAWTKSVAAPDISGQLISGQIADGAVGLTKFASSLSPVTIWTGGSLPTSYQGAALTWGGKLYRWTGSAYVANVDASDVSGVLADGQIANLAASKLLGQIVSTQISDGAISTPKLAANSITGDKIAANSITAANIAVGTLSDNLIGNPQARDGTASWGSLGTSGAGPSTFQGGYGWFEAGRSGFWLDKTNTADGIGVVNRAFPVTPGRKYFLRIAVGGSSTTSAGLYLRMFQMTQQPTNGYTVGGGTLTQVDLLSNAPVVAGVAEQTFVWTCPTGVNWAALAIYNWTNGPLSLYFSDIWLAEQTTSVQIGDGAIIATKIAAGQINGGHIAADTITAGNIAAGAISASELAAGAVTTSKLAVVPESILPDPYFRDPDTWNQPLDAGGWFFESNTGPSGAGNPYALGVLSCLTLGPTGAGVRKHAWGPFVPFSGVGQVLRLRGRGVNYGADWIYHSIQFLKFDGSGNGGVTVAFPPGSGVTNQSSQVTVPEGTAYYRQVTYNLADLADGTWRSVSAVKLDVAASAEMIVDGSITASKILAGSITGDRIAGNTITAGNLAADSITTNALQAGSITAAKLAATSVITLSAQIADAVITNAKIGNLEVDTIKIAGNAITDVNNIADLAGINQNNIGMGAWTTVVTVTVNTILSSDRVLLFVSGRLYAAVNASSGSISSVQGRLRITRAGGAVVVHPANVYVQQSGSGSDVEGSEFISIIEADTPGAGSHTYALEFSPTQSGGSGTLRGRYNFSVGKFFPMVVRR